MNIEIVQTTKLRKLKRLTPTPTPLFIRWTLPPPSQRWNPPSTNLLYLNWKFCQNKHTKFNFLPSAQRKSAKLLEMRQVLIWPLTIYEQRPPPLPSPHDQELQQSSKLDFSRLTGHQYSLKRKPKQQGVSGAHLGGPSWDPQY